MERVKISCVSCSAEYTIHHDLEEPYVLTFCDFCGEEIEEELLWIEDYDDDE